MLCHVDAVHSTTRGIHLLAMHENEANPAELEINRVKQKWDQVPSFSSNTQPQHFFFLLLPFFLIFFSRLDLVGLQKAQEAGMLLESPLQHMKQTR